MKIAIDINGIFGKSGMAQYVKLLVKKLAIIDRENKYLLYAHSWKTRQITGIELPLSDNFQFVHHKFPETLALMSDFKFNLGTMERFLSGHNVELYHGTSNITSKFRNIKSALTIHHYYPMESRFFPVGLNWRERFYFRCTDYSIHESDRIITDSLNTKRDLIKNFNINEDKISVIYPGEPDPLYRVTEKKDEGKYMLFVGPINERKNLERFLEAYSMLVKRGFQHNLVIAGTGRKNYLSLVNKSCMDLKIQDKVVFTGEVPIEKIVSLYNSAELLVYPSLYEGFGYPPLEAMACGCPVAASNATSIPEIVGDAGILFDPYNIEEMAQAIKKILQDPILRQELIKKGFEQVKKFSWEKTARQTLEVYKKVYAKVDIRG